MPSLCWLLAAALPAVVVVTEVLFPLYIGCLTGQLGRGRVLVGYTAAAAAVFAFQAAVIWG